MFCSDCGAKLDDGDRFCSSCGSKISPYEMPYVNEPEPVSEPIASKYWNFYNTMEMDSKGMPDVKDGYFVFGDDRLLLSEITGFTTTKKLAADNELLILGNNGKQICIHINGSDLGLARSLLVFPGSIAAMAIDSYKQKLCLQMMRLAPLCGDSVLKRRCYMASEMMHEILMHNGNLYAVSLSLVFNDIYSCFQDYDEDEYPVFFTVSYGTLMTLFSNKRIKTCAGGVVNELVKLTDINAYSYKDMVIELKRIGKKFPLKQNSEQIKMIDSFFEAYHSVSLDSLVEANYGKNRKDICFIQHDK